MIANAQLAHLQLLNPRHEKTEQTVRLASLNLLEASLEDAATCLLSPS